MRKLNVGTAIMALVLGVLTALISVPTWEMLQESVKHDQSMFNGFLLGGLLSGIVTCTLGVATLQMLVRFIKGL
ncbi:MAG: hypothetical protein U9Q03_00020 [Patescibacteria group bacterium]|nr:hypothetical protein [Patescibacteria group bacterium]